MRTALRLLLASTTALALSALAACAGGGGDAAPTTGPVYFGVSGPVTGPSAEYGRLWKQGFDLAIAKINAAGGVQGRPIALKWEDSQSDPKQTVPIAQKFVDDPSVIAELGDFSSPASMAASAVYQDAGLVQFGFTNSHPDFTKGGDHLWSTSLTDRTLQNANAEFVAKSAKRIAVLYQQTDWGKSAFDVFSASAARLGVTIGYSSAFLPDSTDFRPILINARDSHPEAVVHLGYGPDGALMVKQLRDVGFTGQFFGGQNTPEFLTLAGPAAEGDIITGAFTADDPRPEVVAFVTAFQNAYHEVPGDFTVYAYDALTTVATAAAHGGPTRDGVQRGLLETKDFPSIQFGTFAFDAERRPADPKVRELVVTDGKFVLKH
ncbi:ABC transporter substrate-binding protein [Pseudonocardia spinosispora]|uniref:ABC transporter substrate-binding protein n=1 Tax=Pseudonocardia spinosispora TaxID=103441 RepID=UPI00040DDF77|nr:ABC transporter substrate-binding protein [Pseudonocardia spinosispora]